MNSFLKLPAKKRLDLIIDHKSPLKFVRSLPVQDVLLTIRELGEESSLEIFEMLHPSQVQQILDLEIWAKDQLNPKAAGHYFSILLAANRETAFKQMYELDIELIGLMFKLVATVFDQSLGEDPFDLPPLYSKSPDGRFLICFDDTPKNRGLATALHTFLEDLYGRDIKTALQLLEQIRFELVSGLEESCLRFRQNRLLDLGILPDDERLVFFSPLSKKEISNTLAQPTAALSTNFQSPVSMTIVTDSFNENKSVFLTAALRNASDSEKNIFWQRYTYAALNMYASLSGDFGDRESMIAVSKYVGFLIELGLMQLCRGNSEHAHTIVRAHDAKYLIRMGRTALVTLRSKVRKISQTYQTVTGSHFCHADTPLREVAQAMILPEPRYFEGLLDPKRLSARYFLHIAELDKTVEAINELAFRTQLVDQLKSAHTDLSRHAHLSHSGIIARIAIHKFLGRGESLEAISSQELQDLYCHDGLLSSQFKLFLCAMVDGLAHSIASTCPDSMERSRHFANTLLIGLEKNWQLLIG